MSERLVGIRHAMSIFALLDRRALVPRSGDQFSGQVVGHTLAGTAPTEADDPPDGQGGSAILANFHWHLIGGTTDPATLYLEHGPNIIQGGLENRETTLPCVGLNLVDGRIEDGLCHTLLALVHQAIDKLGDELAIEFRIVRNGPLTRASASRHLELRALFPGLLRTVLRPALIPVTYATRIKRSADDVIANTGDIFHSTSTDHDDRVLLKIVSFTRDVRRHLDTVRQANTRHLTQG